MATVDGDFKLMNWYLYEFEYVGDTLLLTDKICCCQKRENLSPTSQTENLIKKLLETYYFFHEQ